MDTQTLASSKLTSSDMGGACIQTAVARRSARCERLRGGDLVDVCEEAGSTWVLLADVSSKGSRSVEHVELLRAAFRRATRAAESPSRILTALNRLTFASTEDQPEAFAAVFVARFGRTTGTLSYASGGHDTALILRGPTHRHLAPTGPVIGVIPDAAFEDGSVAFDFDDLLLVATDGFTECRRRTGPAPHEQLGTAGIIRALRWQPTTSPHAVCASVTAFADAFTGGDYRDDATLVAVSRR